MSDDQAAQKVKRDLEARWPGAVFNVTYDATGLHVEFVNGNKYVDEIPTYDVAAAEIVEVIRKTFPRFQWTSYGSPEGATVYKE